MIMSKIAVGTIASAIALTSFVGTAEAKMRKHQMVHKAHVSVEETAGHEATESRAMERREHRLLRKSLRYNLR